MKKQSIADKLRIIVENNIKIAEKAILTGRNVKQLQKDLSIIDITPDEALTQAIEGKKIVERIINDNKQYNNPDYIGINPYYDNNEN